MCKRKLRVVCAVYWCRVTFTCTCHWDACVCQTKKFNITFGRLPVRLFASVEFNHFYGIQKACVWWLGQTGRQTIMVVIVYLLGCSSTFEIFFWWMKITLGKLYLNFRSHWIKTFYWQSQENLTWKEMLIKNKLRPYHAINVDYNLSHYLLIKLLYAKNNLSSFIYIILSAHKFYTFNIIIKRPKRWIS